MSPASSSSCCSIAAGANPSRFASTTRPSAAPPSRSTSPAPCRTRASTRFKDGDRLVDALDAAGGPSDDADLAGVNLAKRLHDEDQVVVPRLGQVAAVAGATAVKAKIDINTADASTLDTLPGIGAVYSQRIVDSRTTAGLYQSVDDLVDRKLIPRSTLDKIRDLISVGP